MEFNFVLYLKSDLYFNFMKFGQPNYSIIQYYLIFNIITKHY